MTPEYDKMNKLMDDLSSFGACDSEPCWHLRRVILAAQEGEVFPRYLLAHDNNPWELYSCEESKGWKMANIRLTAQAKKVYAEIQRVALAGFKAPKVQKSSKTITYAWPTRA